MPNLAQEIAKLDKTLNRVVYQESELEAKDTVQAVERQTPRVLQLLRGDWQL
jgi:hypothetical protein